MTISSARGSSQKVKKTVEILKVDRMQPEKRKKRMLYYKVLLIRNDVFQNAINIVRLWRNGSGISIYFIFNIIGWIYGNMPGTASLP
jgi:hypothetical protein